MSPQQGFTVSPVVTETDTGEVVTDFSVSSSPHLDTRSWQDDFVMDSEGQYHHVMQEVELNDESSPTSFDEDAYISNLYEANPQLQSAIAWGADNLSQDQLDVYNKLVDSKDLDDVNQAVDWILNQYQENAYQPEIETDEPYEESNDNDSLLEPDTVERIESLSDDEVDVLNDAIDVLASNEPAGSTVASQWEDFAVQAEDSGNTCMAYVASATAQYHAGEISAEEAIATALNNFDLHELQQVYSYLNQ